MERDRFGGPFLFVRAIAFCVPHGRLSLRTRLTLQAIGLAYAWCSEIGVSLDG